MSRKELVNVQIDHLTKWQNAWESVQINSILWNMVTGNASYKEIFFKVIDLRLHCIMFPHIFYAAIKQAYANLKKRVHIMHTEKLKILKESGLGPLEDGQTVAIIGGGPAGASCAIALKNLAKKRNITIDVIIYEHKDFEGGIEHNECAGGTLSAH